jgi:hypothetical protein
VVLVAVVMQRRTTRVRRPVSVPVLRMALVVFQSYPAKHPESAALLTTRRSHGKSRGERPSGALHGSREATTWRQATLASATLPDEL